MKNTIITCDVVGCKEDAFYEADCCFGWIIAEDNETRKYKKLEKPTKPRKADLCEKHWKDWSKLTIKFLRMNKEID